MRDQDDRGPARNLRLQAAMNARGWERADLADAVNRWLGENDETIGLSVGLIGRWLNGEVTCPVRRYRLALRELFQETDRGLGFYDRRRGATWPGPPDGVAQPGQVQMEDVDRRQMLFGSAALAVMPAGVASAANDALALPPAPARVGQAEITQVSASASAVSSLGFAYGGDFAVRAGLGQLQWANGLLSARCPEHLRPELYSAVSRLAGACGFSAFDALDLDRAARLFDLAAECAAEARDADLLASALGDMALVSLWADDPRGALGRVDRALAQGDRLSPTAEAMLHNTAARAHGQLGDTQETMRCIGVADDAFAGETPEGWLGYYTAGEHAEMGASALYVLAVTTGSPTSEAMPLLEEAAAAHDDAHARSRMLIQARLAVLLMHHGDPDEAAAIGEQALDGAARVQSARAASYLHEMHSASRPHAGRATVDEMRARIADLLLA